MERFLGRQGYGPADTGGIRQSQSTGLVSLTVVGSETVIRPGFTRPDHAALKAEEKPMAWSTPRIEEYECGMEICRYAPADDGEPPLF